MSGKWVDDSKLTINQKLASRIMQEVAFSVGIGWPGGDRIHRHDIENIGYDPSKESLTCLWNEIDDGPPVTLTEWLSWIVTQVKQPEPIKPETTWLDNLVGKKVFTWDNLSPGMNGIWKIYLVESFKIQDGLYYVNGCIQRHIALIDGFESRLFLPRDKWPNHNCEV